VSDCPQLRDLSGLEDTALTFLSLDTEYLTQEALAPVQRLSGLTGLRLAYKKEGPASLPPALPGVLNMTIESVVPIDLSALRHWSSLRALHLRFPSGQFDLTPLHTLANLDVRVSGDPTIVGGEPFGDRLTINATT
jgi:hypothetical protein